MTATTTTRLHETRALLWVLCCAMGAGPLLNYGLSTLSPLIIADLHISEAQFGLLVTATFASAAVSSVWLGRLSDRISNRTQLKLIFGGTAVAMALAALAPDYAVLLLAALLAGPSQAISNPTTNHIIIHHVAPARRPGWIGVKQSGVQGCQLFAGLVFPAVAIWAGWHGAMALGAAIVVVLLLDGLRHLPEDAALPVAELAAGGQAAQAAARGFVPAVWIFAAYALLSGLSMQATNVYLPLFAVRELHFTLVAAGVASGFAGLVGVASRVLWGRRMATGTRASTLLLMISVGALLAAVALLLAGGSGSAWLLWCGVALYGATALGSNVVIMAGIMKVVPPARVGAATGIVVMAMYAGFAAGPLLMGLLLQQTGRFHVGWIMVGSGFVVCLALALALRRYGRPRP